LNPDDEIEEPVAFDKWGELVMSSIFPVRFIVIKLAPRNYETWAQCYKLLTAGPL